MPNYTRDGKIEEPMTETEFKERMEKGKFLHTRHRAFCVLLYYTAIRKTEALRSTREQYRLTKHSIIFQVGKRLKHGITTPPLKIPLNLPYVDVLKTVIQQTPQDTRLFPFSPRTAYNVVRRAFLYPHFFRLSRITNFFLEGWTIPQVHSWTGLSLNALNYYIGLVDIDKMSRTLK